MRHAACKSGKERMFNSMSKQMESRQKERAAAMKMVYEWSMGGDGGAETLQMIYELDGKTPVQEPEEVFEIAPNSFVSRMVQGVMDRVDEIDALINSYSVGWKTDRMPKVDLAILRLGLFELLLGEVPAPIVINEAVELANVYCGDKSGAFVNGVLGNIGRKELQK